MIDPHVTTLYYRVQAREGISYENSPSVAFVAPQFDGILADGVVAIRMLEHFSSILEARVPVDAYLRAWEIAAAIRNGTVEISFNYDRADVIDRSPPQSGQHRMSLFGSARISISGKATMHVSRGSYPPPPSGFKATPLVEILWQRYRGYVAGKEPLFSMAYFCLTALERDAGGRDQAAARYRIDRQVLKTIAELCSTRGTAADARKIVVNGGGPASEQELAWLISAVPALVHQIASCGGDSGLTLLSMTDLPTLARR